MDGWKRKDGDRLEYRDGWTMRVYNPILNPSL